MREKMYIGCLRLQAVDSAESNYIKSTPTVKEVVFDRQLYFDSDGLPAICQEAEFLVYIGSDGHLQVENLLKPS